MAKSSYGEGRSKLDNRGAKKSYGGGYNTKSGTQKSTFSTEWKGSEIKGKKREV